MREPASFLSPVVRRLVAQHHLDVERIEGTGAGGRITRTDVLAASATAPAAEAVEADRSPRVASPAAHAHVIVECDYGEVERVRQDAGLTHLPFVARAVVDALVSFPRCNATVEDDSLLLRGGVHLGIVVHLGPAPATVPVVRAAERLRLRALASAIADLTDRARAQRLGPADLEDASFTITGAEGAPRGSDLSVPIVPAPQAAILAADVVRPHVTVRATADGSDALAVRPVGRLSLGFDHRAFDGAYAASFVDRVRGIIETRDWAQEL